MIRNCIAATALSGMGQIDPYSDENNACAY